MEEAKKEFISGIDIGGQFFSQILQPVLKEKFPELIYSAALIGPGSEVLGFDTTQSTDHDWRPRAYIFVSNDDFEERGSEIEKALLNGQPDTFMGYSLTPEKKEDIRSKYVYSVGSFMKEYLGVESGQPLLFSDWLTIDEHRLLGFTSGKVYSEGLDELKEQRHRFAYYPDDVWKYLLASEWQKISQAEAFVGRTGDVGDELGSQIIATDIVRSLMRLSFYLERKYIPYNKWFGTGFSNLANASKLKPLFDQILSASNWKDREHYLATVYEELVSVQNSLGIIETIDPNRQSFHNRPYSVINAGRISSAIREKISDLALKNIPPIGCVNQFTDSVDFVENKELLKKAKELYL